LYSRKPRSFSATVCCTSLWIGTPLACAAARVDSAGEPACELCGRRLCTVKHHRPHGVGRACAPRCKEKRPLDAGAGQVDAAITHRPKKQRAASDPGEQQMQQQQRRQSRVQPTTRRVLPSAPVAEQTQPRSMRSTEKIARQLEETHARRMAAIHFFNQAVSVL